MPKFTKTTVDDAAPSAKEAVLWDTELKGFGLRVKPTGVKSYLIQYRDAQGKSKRVTIGQHGRITCEQARDEAKRQLAKITLGNDPRAERDATRLAPTLSQLCADYLAAAEAGTIITRRGKSKSSSTLIIDRGRIKNHIDPILGKKLARDLRAADVRSLLAAVTLGKTATSGPSGKLRGRIDVDGGKGTAKKAVNLLSAILAYGVETGTITDNVARGVRLPKDGVRNVADPEGMLRALGCALALAEANGENSTAIAAFRLALLTGMRKGEVTGLKWSEVDFSNDAFRLADSKNGKSIRPISQAAREILRPLHPQQKGPFVFASPRSPETRYGGLPNAVQRIKRATYLDKDTRSALAGFSLHIARHLVGSVANALDVSEITIGALLGHAKGSVTQKYVSKIDRHLLAQANKVSGAVQRLLRDGEPQEPLLSYNYSFDLEIDDGDPLESDWIIAPVRKGRKIG